MSRRPMPTRLVAAATSVAAAGGLALGAGLAPAAHAADPLPGIDGDGSSRAPYQLDSADDLRTAADAINADRNAYGGASYRLTADIDYGGAEFGGINTFTGVLEGAGHTISDIELVPEPSAGGQADRLGLVRQLDGGTVRNLTLDGVRADGGDRGGFIGGIAVIAAGATLTGNSVLDADLVANSAEKVGGIVAELDGGTISNNRVTGTLSAFEMPAGVAAYVKGAATVRHNLVAADLTMIDPGGDQGNKGNDAGMIVGYPGTPNSSTFEGNVALAGSIAYEGKVDGFVGRIAGYTAYDGWTARDNLADAAITISGSTVSGPGTKNQHGTDATAEQLSQRATYEDLGWDFVDAWAWDEEAGHPVPTFTESLPGDGSDSLPYEIATPEDLEHLAASINRGSTRYTEAHVALTADLDLTDREPFGGINRFAGVLDGAGHTITGLTLAPDESAGDQADRLGLIRRLDGGTVRHLTLDGLRADGGDRAGLVGGLAVVATDATLTGNSVVDAELSAPAAEKVAGLVAELRGGVATDNRVQGTVRAHKMPAGLVSYAIDGVALRHNLVDVDLVVETDGGEGTRGVDAGAVLAYPGNPSSGGMFSGNVALAGSIEYAGTVDGFVGRIVGFTGYDGWSAADNLADAATTVGGSTVSGPGTKNQHGTDATAEQLAQRATYEDLGWDFAAAWAWDDEAGHPVPKYVTPSEAPNRITTTFHGDPGTRRAFTWYSTLDAAPTVTLSTDRSFPEGSSTTEIAAEADTSEGGETFYRAVAQDLTPGTTYYYRLGDAAESVWSPVGTFETASGDDDFTFVDLTDTQSQNLAEAELSAQTIAKALEHTPEAEFVVHNGDVVEHGGREQDWSDLLDSARSSLLSTTLAPAAGNHDAATNAFADHFTLDGTEGQDTGSGVYYSYTYNQAHFMVLNTNDGADGVSPEQLEWLRADAEQARADGARWLVLTMHKGVYTTANHLDDADVMAMRRNLVPVIDELGIDLVLQGHDHVMSRSKVLAADPDGVQGARPVETTRITEVRNGKRVEYAVDPEGTLYFLPNTAGAKHYRQATSPQGVDLEEYLQLFDRTGERSTENFTKVRVTDDRLTVEVYDIRDQGVPRMFEGFGIDRAISPVAEQVDGLPAVEDVTLEDAEQVAAVRAAVDGLTEAQRGTLTGLPRLEAAERRLRELQGLVSTDGSQVAWADGEATARQTVAVRNDTRTDLGGTPVQVRLADTPDVGRDELSVFAPDGTPLPFEVETWQPGETSALWVRVPRLPAGEAQTVWLYFGGGAPANDPAAVWGEEYSLVEHFGADLTTDEPRTDSTGTRDGVVVGEDLTSTVSERGTGEARFDASRLQYAGDVGGDHDKLSISGVYTFTADDLAQGDGDAAVIAKESTGTGNDAFWQGVRADGRLGTRLVGNSWEFSDVDRRHQFEVPADGEPHLVTQTYDGMTYSVFVDGREVHSEMLEYRTTLSDPAVRTTVGGVDTGDGSLAATFHGTVDEVQVAGIGFSPDHERFRYENLLGDAVTSGPRVERGDEPVTLLVGTPRAGTEVEAGLVDVAGSLNVRAMLTAELDGEEVFREEVDAGPFTVPVPVNPATDGEAVLRLHAAAVDGDAEASAPVEVPLEVTDTTAPAAPAVSHDVAGASGRATLSATPRTDDREEVEATFHAAPTIPLDGSNVVVRTGTTTDKVPSALTPASGKVADGLTPTTTGENENPFHVYEVSLTEEQAAQDSHHLVWRGTGDDRQVSAWVYDHEAERWLLKDSASDPAGGTVELDVTARADEHSVADGTLHLLVWRGLTELPDDEVEGLPAVDTYDFGMDHVGDTQLYAQATPDLMTHQFEYVRDVADERKTSMVVQAGDWVNREYLSQEYQWVAAEPSARALEEAGIPYFISWGNHDYSEARNGRVMLPRYFPMERLAASLEGSPWEFGGSDDIDNYYYTAEISGAKLLLLTVGFFSSNNADDAGLDWAQGVIEAHPDHSVILASHQSVNQGVNGWANDHVTGRLVDPYSNVKLVLGGHIGGTGVAARETAGGNVAYGVLTDYQSRVYGGQEFLKHLSVDVENDLIHFNSYSPMLDATTSDGGWHHEVPQGAIPGYHGKDTENFVLEVDLGGTTTRTLAAESLSLAGPAEQVGEPQRVVGDETATVLLEGARRGTAYEWYAELRDPAGHTTRSTVSTFTVAGPSAPGAPQDVAATVDGQDVTVTWAEPADDGGSAVRRYEVALDDGGDGTVVTVKGRKDTVTFTDLAPGTYTATVRANNAAGWSPVSEPSDPVVVEPATSEPGAWDAGTVYTADDEVTFDGGRWLASWWTRNQEPGDPYGPWQEIAVGEDGTALWTPSRIFVAGDVVEHQGQRFEATWWTRNQEPGDATGPWRPVS